MNEPVAAFLLRLGVVAGLAAAGRALWQRRDREQIAALLAVARRKPTLYRVTLNRQVPLVEIQGDGARFIGVHVNNGSTAFRVKNGGSNV